MQMLAGRYFAFLPLLISWQAWIFISCNWDSWGKSCEGVCITEQKKWKTLHMWRPHQMQATYMDIVVQRVFHPWCSLYWYWSISSTQRVLCESPKGCFFSISGGWYWNILGSLHVFSSAARQLMLGLWESVDFLKDIILHFEIKSFKCTELVILA